MSKWGLLRGAGQGVAQAGNMLMADRLDQAKEQRLQKYQESLQQKQFEREDKVRAEDRTDQQIRDAQQLSLRAGEIGLAQQNADRNYELDRDRLNQSSELVTRQLDQLDQQIEIGGIELEQVRGRDELRQKILSETDPEKRMQLMGDYASLANDFNTEPKTITSYGEVDEVTGQQTRVTMQWDAASRSWKPITPESGRPSPEELMGAPPADSQPTGAPGSQTNPMQYGAQSNPANEGGGLLRRPNASELSEELGVTVNPGVTERVGGAVQAVGNRIGEFTTGQNVRWVKQQIQQGSIDQPNMANRHAYRSALESGELTEQEATIIRRLLSEQ